MAAWIDLIGQTLVARANPRSSLEKSSATFAPPRRQRLLSPAWCAWPRTVRITCSRTTPTLPWWSTNWWKRRVRWGRRSVHSTTSCWKLSVAPTRRWCAFCACWMNTNTTTSSRLELRGPRNKWVNKTLLYTLIIVWILLTFMSFHVETTWTHTLQISTKDWPENKEVAGSKTSCWISSGSPSSSCSPKVKHGVIQKQNALVFTLSCVSH